MKSFLGSFFPCESGARPNSISLLPLLTEFPLVISSFPLVPLRPFLRPSRLPARTLPLFSKFLDCFFSDVDEPAPPSLRGYFPIGPSEAIRVLLLNAASAKIFIPSFRDSSRTSPHSSSLALTPAYSPGPFIIRRTDLS